MLKSGRCYLISRNQYQAKDRSNTMLLAFVVCVILMTGCSSQRNESTIRWWPPDYIDAIVDKMAEVTSSNCEVLNTYQLRLPSDTLSQMPRFSSSADVRLPNRTLLWHAHSLALTRAVSFSFTFAKLKASADYTKQPGLMYHYTSSVADVTANADYIKGSGLFYDTNTHYPSWYTQTLPFNKTLPLFGPRAYSRATNQSATDWDVDVTDYGAGPDHNYASPEYKHNPWYSLFLPDAEGSLDSVHKSSYNVLIKYNESQQFESHVFFSATQSMSEYEPVVFTPPYFDCGKSNAWMVSAVAPLTDYLPRYLDWHHLRRHRFMAESVVDVLFEDIDMNQCPLSLGNTPPNGFAGTARCKSDTTTCVPLHGYGFRRGGYQCHCRFGLVYPPGQTGPFTGSHIENATQEEYEQQFDCITPTKYEQMKRDLPERTPTDAPKEISKLKRRISPRYKRTANVQSKPFDPDALIQADNIFLQMYLQMCETQKDNDTQSPAITRLSKEAAYGAEEQFQSEARLAVRLANFLSNYLQNQVTDDGDDPREDKPLHRDFIISEVMATVLGDTNVLGCGVFFDEDKFEDQDGVVHTHFGPYAYGKIGRDVRVRDRTADSPMYVDDPWFTQLRDYWSLTTEGLKLYRQYPMIRSDVAGSGLEPFISYPMDYRAASVEEGIWSAPHTPPCDGQGTRWLITYAVPFFGKDAQDIGIEFKGVVTVELGLENLNIHQCPQEFWVPNAFKNTAQCDYTTTKCEPVRQGFQLGSYQCVCKEGFMYESNRTQPFTAEEVEATDKNSSISCVTMEHPTDSGPTDSGPTDSSGTADSSSTDSGPTDSGPTDSGPTDSGPTDSFYVGSGRQTHNMSLITIILIWSFCKILRVIIVDYHSM